MKIWTFKLNLRILLKWRIIFEIRISWLTQGSDQIDSFLFANFRFVEVNQKSQKRFWFARWMKIFFFDSRGRIILFLFLIDFDSRFKLIVFILIRLDFNSSQITPHPRIMIHLRIKIKSNQKSKVGESWLTHLRIIGWFDFGSKANQSESRIKLVRALD